MEHVILHSDLVNGDIKPQEMLKKYHHYLESDIKKYFQSEEFFNYGCPTNGETQIKKSFKKMGMDYCVSETFGNVYISPRPKQCHLMNFYQKSNALKFWLRKLWKETNKVRKEKIIRPQINWVRTFTDQNLNDRSLLVAEYYPIQWGYFEEVLKSELDWEYFLVRPMFPLELSDLPDLNKYVINFNDDINQKFDVIFLFEALDRSEDPFSTLQWVVEHLKPGGLCFVTCLLASGFEAQILGQDSNVFTPPERMNVFSYEGVIGIFERLNKFELLEFSTPGVLDIPNIIKALDQKKSGIPPFIRYMLRTRNDADLLMTFQDFLQMNKLCSFGRLVLRKNTE